jgi:hypothetical protein
MLQILNLEILTLKILEPTCCGIFLKAVLGIERKE